jgi:hypothetical protein
MRESRYTQVARRAYSVAKQNLPTYSHPKSRHDYTLPQRVACVLLKIYLNLTYRDRVRCVGGRAYCARSWWRVRGRVGCMVSVGRWRR